jgi:transposase
MLSWNRLTHAAGILDNLIDRSESSTEPCATRDLDAMVRNKVDAELTAWIARARSSLVASFANGVAKDEAAVRAAISLPWSNGQTEGQITKLKLVKRQMYGRAKIDLLHARLIGAI